MRMSTSDVAHIHDTKFSRAHPPPDSTRNNAVESCPSPRRRYHSKPMHAPSPPRPAANHKSPRYTDRSPLCSQQDSFSIPHPRILLLAGIPRFYWVSVRLKLSSAWAAIRWSSGDHISCHLAENYSSVIGRLGPPIRSTLHYTCFLVLLCPIRCAIFVTTLHFHLSSLSWSFALFSLVS